MEKKITDADLKYLHKDVKFIKLDSGKYQILIKNKCTIGWQTFGPWDLLTRYYRISDHSVINDVIKLSGYEDQRVEVTEENLTLVVDIMEAIAKAIHYHNVAVNLEILAFNEVVKKYAHVGAKPLPEYSCTKEQPIQNLR
jgi:hypothetical protein